MLRFDHIVRTFGANRAVDGVSLVLERGSIVALAGENGAGKTTLMRIGASELSPDSGTVAATGAVALVHQHFQLVNELTIAENLALMRPGFFFYRSLNDLATRTIADSGIALADVTRRVADLSVGEKSKLELIKAISLNPSTLILDEPTSVLTPNESQELFAVMRRLASQGTAVVFISHKLPEVLAVAQRVVVMRRGAIVLDTTTATASDIAGAMIGDLEPPRPMQRTPGPPALAFDNLVVHEREIVAIVGVAGNGQPELAARLRDRFPEAAHIPEDRTRDGIIAELSIAENFALRTRESDLIPRFNIRAHSPAQKAGSLSGGNQQKVILARELSRNPRILVAAEPTRGLDLEATRFVRDQLRDAAARGAAVVLMTSDLDEAFELADAIHVIYRGKLSERMTTDVAAQNVGNLMAGLECGGSAAAFPPGGAR